jgi:hypothetical protein
VAVLVLVLWGLLRRRVAAALAGAAVVGGALGTTEACKHLVKHFGQLHDRALYGGISSYPSGHATIAASVGLAALLVAPSALRPLVALTGAAYAAAVGVSLVVLGGHEPSDVAGGYLVAATWAAAAGALIADRIPPDPRRRRVGLVGALAAAALALAIAVAVASSRHPTAATVRSSTTVIALIVVYGAFTLAVFGTFTALIERREQSG